MPSITGTPAPALVRTALAEAGLDRIPPGWPAPLERFRVEDVRAALAHPPAPFRPERLAAFLSPAAGEALEEMAQAARALTEQRFGRTMALYAPLYVSNYCINRCVYCGFNACTHAERRRLSVEEALADARIIREEGFRDILLVSGEDPGYVTTDYLATLARELRALFASVSVEIYPLDEAGYQRLFAAGVDGVTLYQETYDRDTYARVHDGPKADYDARLAAQEAAARAGMRRLGLGALLGLADWRYETFALAIHARTLMKHFWRARIAFSFPRIREAASVDLRQFCPVTDRDLAQMMVALRLSFPDAALVLSTREAPGLRDHLLPLGITQISAGSRTTPGGYGGSQATEQFAVSDTRSAREVVDHLARSGYDPVWKDWDSGFQGR